MSRNHSDYCAIYRGVVVDNSDPETLGRIKMMVPQVTGTEVTDWAWPVGGALGQAKFVYGNFSSSQTQLVSAANTVTLASFNTTEDINNMSLVSGTKLTVTEAGDYFVQFSAQFYKSGAASAVQADIWLRLNGVDVPRTNSRVTLSGNPNETLITLCYIIDMLPGDYLEIAFSSADAAVGLHALGAQTSPTRPAIPSIIATINLLGLYVPKPGQAVWAAFEGGDPNFPIWLGAC